MRTYHHRLFAAQRAGATMRRAPRKLTALKADVSAANARVDIEEPARLSADGHRYFRAFMPRAPLFSLFLRVSISVT